MDLRTKKTRRSIKNAFLQLRASKDIERITVKELADLAEISKATFYLHYHDVYDLSDELEKEVIQNCLDSIPHPEYIHGRNKEFVHELVHAFTSQLPLINTVFSGSRAAFLPINIEKEIKHFVFQAYPHLKEDAAFNILLTYEIMGGYFAYMENYQQFGIQQVADVVGHVSGLLATNNRENQECLKNTSDIPDIS